MRDASPIQAEVAAALLDGLRMAGRHGPFAFEHGFIRCGHHTVVTIGPTPDDPDLRRLVGEFFAAALTALVAEATQAESPHAQAAE